MLNFRLNESTPHRAVHLVNDTALAQNAYKMTRNRTEQGSVGVFNIFFMHNFTTKCPRTRN